jgi:endonuclease/exonuclease/phosphatase family metal-dependent hydrolase
MSGVEQPHLLVATWNVHGCVGLDRTFDPVRTAEALCHIDADLIALQEVDSRHHRSRGLDTFAYLCESADRYAFRAVAIDGDSGHYGQMLLSRWPLEGTRVHDISVAGREPRRVIEAQVAWPGGEVRAFATHLGLRASERRQQVAALRRITSAWPSGPAVILGDFNEPRRRVPEHRSLAPEFAPARPWPTYPTRLPLLPLDRIWCRRPLTVIRSWTLRKLARASDHLPLLANLAWK